MPVWPQGTARIVLAETDSTNAEALRHATAGAAGPLWVLAHHQTAARGRRGRAWAMPAGNFAASLLIRPVATPQEAALRSFVAALALQDALAAVTGAPERFALKWPNDVLLDGKKLAGILLETGPGAPRALVVGFGVNLVAAPPPSALEDGALAPVALAQAFGTAPDPEALLAELAPAFAAWEAVLGTEGFGPVREAWLARAAGRGTPMRARLPGRELAGRFDGIDLSGALLLATATGPVALAAAEVHFLPDAIEEAGHAARH